MRKNKIKFQEFLVNLKKGAENFAIALAKRAFLTTIFLLILALLISGLVFYKSLSFALPEKVLLISAEKIQFNERGYLEVLNLYQSLQESQVKIKTQLKELSDPFWLKD